MSFANVNNWLRLNPKTMTGNAMFIPSIFCIFEIDTCILYIAILFATAVQF